MATHAQAGLPGNDGAGTTSQVVNSRNPDGQDAFNIDALSPDELGKLLDNDYDLDVDLDIPDNLFGADGGMELDFDANDYAQMHHANSAPVHSPNQAHKEGARSVLASMDSAQPAEHSIHMHHHAHSAPTHMFPNGTQISQQAVYIKDASGNFVQVMVNLPVAMQASMGGIGSMMPNHTVLSGVPFHAPQNSGEVQYHVQQSMMPNMDPFQQFMPMNAHMLQHESGSVQTSPVKNSPVKKKSRAKRMESGETVHQQRVRADKGYTSHPKSGVLMRHGAALEAYTKDNKEIPAIKDIFATFAKNDGFSRGPPAIHIEARAGGVAGPLCSNLVKTHMEAEKRSQEVTEAATTEIERTKLIGVSRDEWSLFWKAHVERRQDGGANGEGAEVDAAENEATGHADKKEANNSAKLVFCGEYPSMEQAARGHDVVAIKIHGESALLNFPVDHYKALLPVIEGHSEEELVNAVLKDAELSMQRTSKFKGVRKTGPNHYEAAIDTEMVARALQQNAKHEKKNTVAAGEAPVVPHRTTAFHA